MSCATAPAPKPAQTIPPGVPRQLLIDLGAGSAERCVSLIVVLCAKVDACGGDYNRCVDMMQPMRCMDVGGIEEVEAEACAHALDRLPCDGQVPDECLGIGEAPHVGPTHRDL